MLPIVETGTKAKLWRWPYDPVQEEYFIKSTL